MNKKRCAIYFFFDEDGVVDRYNISLMKDLKKSVEHLLVVVNGLLTKQGEQALRDVADDVLVRENIGFDSWAYKAGIEHIGWDTLYGYDEIIQLNHTNFGPVYPFSEMFAAMDNRAELDFWGITRHYGMPNDPFHCCEYGYIPEHIQSHFIAFRKTLVADKAFKEYWDSLPPIRNYDEAVALHEARLTKHFADLGFAWDTYINTSAWKEKTNYPLMLYPVELMREQRCPIFKRKMLFYDKQFFLENTADEGGEELINFLASETDFDIDQIWENLLRTVHLCDLMGGLHSMIVLPDEDEAVENPVVVRTALVAYVPAEDAITPLEEAFSALPIDADIWIATPSQALCDEMTCRFQGVTYGKLTVKASKDAESLMQATLLLWRKELANYDFLCMVDLAADVPNTSTGVLKSNQKRTFQSLLAGKYAVNLLLEKFMEDLKIGMIIPSTPYHGAYGSRIGAEWGYSFEATKALAKKLHVTVPLDKQKEPLVSADGCAWVRVEAMRTMLMYPWRKQEIQDVMPPTNPAISYTPDPLRMVLPFVMQTAGYYPISACTQKWMRVDCTDLKAELRDFQKPYLAMFENASHMFMNCQNKNVIAECERLRKNVAELERDIRWLQGTWWYRLLHGVKNVITAPIRWARSNNCVKR